MRCAQAAMLAGAACADLFSVRYRSVRLNKANVLSQACCAAAAS